MDRAASAAAVASIHHGAFEFAAAPSGRNHVEGESWLQTKVG